MNWISATGFRPIAAMPTAMPAIVAFGERRIMHAVAAEALLQANGRAKHAAIHADVLAEHSTSASRCHLLGERQIDRLDERDIQPWLTALVRRAKRRASSRCAASVRGGAA